MAAEELRKTGISVVGDQPWGTHFCHFYEAKQDLLDILIPYFKAGLENNEFCLWVVSDSELITVEEAQGALAQAVPDLDRHLSDESIEILNRHDWYFEQHALNLERAKHGWDAKLKRALARGYQGMRASADTFWLGEKDWKDFFAYEKQVHEWITNQSMTVICTYPLAKSGAIEILDVVHAHQFAIARRHGKWEVVETPELIQAQAEIKKLNKELEQRVVERTQELAAANEELRKEIAERKRAEEALRASETTFRRLLDSSIIGVVFWDLNGNLLSANDLFLNMTGYSREDLQQGLLSWKNLTPPEYAYVDDRAVAELQVTGTCVPFEKEYIRKDGSRVSVLIGSALLEGHDDKGSSFIMDITERKRSEEKLKQSESQLAQAQRLAHIGSWDWDLRTNAVTWSDELYHIFGLQPGTINVAGEVDRFIHPDDLDLGWDTVKRAVASKETYDYYHRILRADGTERIARSRGSIMSDERGEPIKVFGATQDVTELKHAEEKLKHSEVQLAQAQRLAHVGSWDWDLRTNKVTWSDELCRIFGLEPGTIMVAGDAMSFIHPDDQALVRSTVKDAVANKERYSFYYRALRPDGTERIVHSRGSVLTDERGEAIRVFGATQDVTELRQAEDDLKATAEQLRALSASVQSAREEESKRITRELHDELGGALTALRWDLEEVGRVVSKATDATQLSALPKKIEAMTALTGTTLDTIRRLASELRPMALDELGLVEAIEWQAQQFQTRTGIAVEYECSQEKVDLNSEQSTAVFRILQEALTNVLRHAQATEVIITVKQESGEFFLAIRDNGKGITEGEKSGAHSLGLLGMRERAHLIGAQIDITGIEGKGTLVAMRIPISKSSERERKV